jgi:pimeloyl-ACP methyl ester carboxylesterase
MHALLDNLPPRSTARVRTVRANGIEIRTEAFGDPARPAVLLIQGANTSMCGYPEALCAWIADAGFLVIRYDNRDTGQSTGFTPKSPGYTVANLAGDAVGVLDACGIARAHVIGFSMGGMIVQHLAIFHASRVVSAAIGGSSPEPLGAHPAAIPESERLPMPAPRVLAMGAMLATVDWDDKDAAIAGVMHEVRTLLGSGDVFNEDAVRAFAVREVTRARNVAGLRLNHPIAVATTPRWRHRLKDIVAPTLVLHGSDDAVLPVAHGVAMAKEIPGANLTVIDGMGHMLAPSSPLWSKASDALIAHIASVR